MERLRQGKTSQSEQPGRDMLTVPSNRVLNPSMKKTGSDNSAVENTTIESDLDFLRAVEHDKSHHRHASVHDHHIHVSNHHNPQRHGSTSSQPTPQPSAKQPSVGSLGENRRQPDTDSSGSTQHRHHHHLHLHRHHDSTSRQHDETTKISNHESETIEDGVNEETEDLSPEMRRELERRHAAIEEKRVADAAAAYRQQSSTTTGGTIGRSTRTPTARSSAIQDRVKNLLDESNRTLPVKKTASGYGKYTETETVPTHIIASAQPRDVPSPTVQNTSGGISLTTSAPADIAISADQHDRPRVAGTTGAGTFPRNSKRPSAPPKPLALRTVSGTGSTARASVVSDHASAVMGDAWEEEFSKRYPSLSFDMIETEVPVSESSGAATTPLRIRDV